MNPSRYVVTTSWDRWGGDGFTVWDLVEDRQAGGWSKYREGSEFECAAMNETPP